MVSDFLGSAAVRIQYTMIDALYFLIGMHKHFHCSNIRRVCRIFAMYMYVWLFLLKI